MSALPATPVDPILAQFMERVYRIRTFLEAQGPQDPNWQQRAMSVAVHPMVYDHLRHSMGSLSMGQWPTGLGVPFDRPMTMTVFGWEVLGDFNVPAPIRGTRGDLVSLPVQFDIRIREEWNA